ncbi:hypothetical protein HOF92_10845 [bacterium]|jgi:hypothetical protein|nr:hypothetical protein [bacterium]
MDKIKVYLEEEDSEKVFVGIRKNEKLTQISMMVVKQYLQDFQPYFLARDEGNQPRLSSPGVLDGLLKIRELYEKGWDRDEILFALLNSVRAGRDLALEDVRLESFKEKKIA